MAKPLPTTPPTLKQFSQAVREMRSNQKRYFAADRNTPEKHEALRDSRVAERLVDAYLLLIENDKQQSMFEEDANA